MKKSLFLLFFATLFFIAGCSNTKARLFEPEAIFTTKIFDNSAKQFNYHLTIKRNKNSLSEYQNKSKNRRTRERNDQKNRVSIGKSPKKSSVTRQKLSAKGKARLEEKIMETAYCRDGYMILDEYITKESISYRGECYDLASDEDREKYPSQKKAGVTEEFL